VQLPAILISGEWDTRRELSGAIQSHVTEPKQTDVLFPYGSSADDRFEYFGGVSIPNRQLL